MVGGMRNGHFTTSLHQIWKCSFLLVLLDWFSWKQNLLWGIGIDSLLEQWSQNWREKVRIIRWGEEDDMNVDYHGHWYVHGASILLEPPHFFWWTRMLMAIHHLLRAVSGYFTPPHSGVVLSDGPAVFPGPGTECGKVRGTSLKWNAVCASGVWNIQAYPLAGAWRQRGLGDVTQGTGGICYPCHHFRSDPSHHLLRTVMKCQTLG